MFEPTKITAPEEVGLSTDRLARIQPYMQKYLDGGKLAALSTMVARRGQIAHFSCQGSKEFGGPPLTQDTIFRIYSMSKPITSVGLMMLYEQGAFRLDHPVHRYLPEFKDTQVWTNGTADSFVTEPQRRPMQIIDLLRHTSGLTYDFMLQHPVDKLYRKNKIFTGRGKGYTLEQFVKDVAAQPLMFHPGESWNYSVSTDICGRLIEVMSGQSLGDYFAEHIFKPLKMVDTGFKLSADKVDRFASCYEKDPVTREVKLQDAPETSPYLEGSERAIQSGGGGLVSTMSDYMRFAQMLLNGGELDGARLLSPTTLKLMTLNHLENNQTIGEMGDSLFTEATMDGTGFGLGFGIVIDQARAADATSQGAFSWGGAASTYFWIDPKQDLVGLMMTQIMPSTSYPIRPQFQQLVYASIID